MPEPATAYPRLDDPALLDIGIGFGENATLDFTISTVDWVLHHADWREQLAAAMPPIMFERVIPDIERFVGRRMLNASPPHPTGRNRNTGPPVRPGRNRRTDVPGSRR